MKNTTVTHSLILVAPLTTLFALTSTESLAQGSFYAGGNIGAVFGGNTRADGVFTGTGTELDGQRLGPEPGETASGNFDPNFTANAMIGYDFGKRRFGRVRVEGELFLQNADTSSYAGELNGVNLDPEGQVDTALSGIVVNALYDIVKFSNVTSYLFVGYGSAQAETSYSFEGEERVDIDGQVVVIQGGFGADIPFSDRVSFDLKYRFRRAGLNEGGLDTDIDAQILEVGVRYSF